MTGFAGPLHVLEPYTDVTGVTLTNEGEIIASAVAVAKAIVSGTTQSTSYLLQGNKNAVFTVTALTSTQSTAFSTLQPYVMLIMTVGGTSVAFRGYPAGSLAG